METDVKIEIEMGHVKIPVNVNDQGPFNFVLDTGASFTTLFTSKKGMIEPIIDSDANIASILKLR